MDEKYFIDKEGSLMLKGLAITLMFYHHLFGFPFWIAEANMYIGTSFHGHILQEALGLVGKICVAIFAFISGYALYVNRQRYSKGRDFINKAVEFLLQYWVVFAIFIVLGILFKEPLPSLERFIAQCFGTCTATGFNWEYRNTIHPIFAWYVSFFLLFLLLHPALRKLSRYNFLIDNIIYLLVFHVTYQLISAQQFVSLCHDTNAMLKSFALWGHIGMMGYLFAKYAIYTKVDNLMRKFLPSPVLAIICSIILVAMVYLRYKSRMLLILDAVYTPILIYAFLTILHIINMKILHKLFILLGTYSMNMWFLHGIFYTPSLTFQPLAY